MQEVCLVLVKNGLSSLLFCLLSPYVILCSLYEKTYASMKHDFLKLDFWKKSRLIVKDVYLLTKNFPPEEKFGLTSQIRRAAVSIPSNIAEGCGRGSNSQFSHFLDVAMGSACEVETQLYLANDLGYTTLSEAKLLVVRLREIRSMIIGFQRSKLS